jgi:hypothetical protein
MDYRATSSHVLRRTGMLVGHTDLLGYINKYGLRAEWSSIVGFACIAEMFRRSKEGGIRVPYRPKLVRIRENGKEKGRCCL